MNIFYFSTLFNAVSFLVLGIIVWLKGRNKALNITWFGFCMSLMIWSAGYYGLEVFAKNMRDAALWLKFEYIGTPFIHAFFFHFTTVLLDIRKKQRKLIIFLYALSTTMVLSVFFGNLFIRNIVPKPPFPYYPEPGIMYHLFFVSFWLTLAYAHYLMLRSYKKVSPQKRLQIKYLFVGSVFAFFGGGSNFMVIYNLPLFPYGNYFMCLYGFIITYAIVKHRLLEMEVLIKKTIVFGGIFGAVFCIAALIVGFLQDFIIKFVRVNAIFAIAVSIFVLLLIYEPLKALLIHITDRFLFQKKYGYKELFEVFIRDVIGVLNLDEITSRTLDLFEKAFHPHTCAIILKNKGRFEVFRAYGLGRENIIFDDDSRLINVFLRTSEIIINNQIGMDSEELDIDTKGDIDRLKAYICVPMKIHDELIGILSLGGKKSDDDYNREEVDLLCDLGRTLAVAITNSRLFAEAAQAEKLAAVGTLAAGINHEIRNPLNIMYTEMELYMLKMKKGLYKNLSTENITQETLKILNGCIVQIERIAEITKKLSTFSKPTSDDEFRKASIDEIIDGTLSVLTHELQLEKVELRRNISEDLPSLFVDKGQIQQVFFNLIKNAAQALKNKKGIITITADVEADKTVRIEIEDNGTGIPEDKLNRIYDPFYTTKAPGEGTGLGLSIVRQLVWRNRGDMAVQSKLGIGTRFILTFPIGRNERKNIEEKNKGADS